MGVNEMLETGFDVFQGWPANFLQWIAADQIAADCKGNLLSTRRAESPAVVSPEHVIMLKGRFGVAGDAEHRVIHHIRT